MAEKGDGRKGKITMKRPTLFILFGLRERKIVLKQDKIVLYFIFQHNFEVLKLLLKQM